MPNAWEIVARLDYFWNGKSLHMSSEDLPLTLAPMNWM